MAAAKIAKVRARAAARLNFLGVSLDASLNGSTHADGEIGAAAAPPRAADRSNGLPGALAAARYSSLGEATPIARAKASGSPASRAAIAVIGLNVEPVG